MTIARQLPDNTPTAGRTYVGWVRDGAFAAGIQIIAYFGVGYGLNFYFTGWAALAVVFPLMAVLSSGSTGLFALTLAVSIGSFSVWGVASGHAASALSVATLLLSTLLVEAGAVRLLRTCRVDAWLAAAGVTIVTAAWLSWPIWLVTAPPLAVRLQPMLTINGVLLAEVNGTVWTEEPIAYQLTLLGQHLTYALPTSIGFAVAVYTLAGAMLLLADAVIDRALGGRSKIDSSHPDR